MGLSYLGQEFAVRLGFSEGWRTGGFERGLGLGLARVRL